MTIPKWLLPVISIVAAIAVAASAVLIGMHFASPSDTTVAAPTVVAPVLGPVDPSVALSAVADKDGNLSSSPVLGSRTVTAPGTFPVGTVPSDIAQQVADLAAADNPGDPTDPALLPADNPAPVGDPCSPADGSDPPAGCPGGLHSVILHDIALPPLTVGVGSTTRQVCGSYDPSDTTSLFLEVVTNAPASTVVTWQQDGSPAHTLTVSSTDAVNTRWQSDLAGADSINSWIWVRTCLPIHGVDPYLSTRITMAATDFQGRRATKTQTWQASQQPGRPRTDIIPVGNSTVFVSAPFRPQDEVRIRAFTVQDEAIPNCDNATEITGSLRVVSPLETHVVSRDSLTAAHYDTSFTKRTSTAFAVPAQTRIMVCVRWYAEGRAAWDQDTPSYQDELILAAPAVVSPVVTLEAVSLSRSFAANSIQITGSTEDGIDCGSNWTGPEANGSLFTHVNSYVVCDFGSLLGRQDADGALNVVTHVPTDHGVAVMSNLLPIQLAPCADGCAARTRTFDVPLSTFVRPTALCSGDCPTNTGQSIGTARVTARWPAQAAGGTPGWYFGEHVEGVADMTPPDFPRMDDTVSIALGAVDTVNRSQSASFHIRTDRPSSYRVDLNSGGCIRPGGADSYTSSVAATDATVNLRGLCLGTGYRVTVTLSDAAGHTSVYALGSSEHFWLGGQFFTESSASSITAELSVSKAGAPLVYVRTIQLDLDNQRSTIHVIPGYDCYNGAITPSRRAGDFHFSENIPIAVYVAFSLGTDPQVTDIAADGSTQCRPVSLDQTRINFTGAVTLDQIAAGATVRMTDPTTGYVATLTLHNYHP